MIKEIIMDVAALSEPCRESLREEARPVIQDLMDTANAHKKNCAGLAANQVDSDLRVFVVKVRGRFVAFVNPSYKCCGKMFKSTEGCLSFPGRKSQAMRCALIRTSPDSKGKCYTLDGVSAIAFQHEIDHINGKII